MSALSDVMTVVKWAQLALALICIAAGLTGPRRWIAAMGVMGGASAAIWLLRGIVAEPLLISLACVAYAAAAVWWYRSIASKGIVRRPNPLFVIVFIADAAVAGLLLYLLRDPVPVLITFGLVYIGSVVSIRTLTPTG